MGVDVWGNMGKGNGGGRRKGDGRKGGWRGGNRNRVGVVELEAGKVGNKERREQVMRVVEGWKRGQVVQWL